MSRFLDLVNERVVIFDGAIGTYLQELGPHRRRLRRARPRGLQRACSSVTRPDVIARAARVVLRGRRRRRRDRHASAPSPSRSASTASPTGPTRSTWRRRRIAREVADGYATGPAGSPARWARAPSSPSLGQIRFAELRDAYEVQARGLLEGGVDLLLIETHFDLLRLKAAIIGARRAMAARRPRGADPGPGHHGADRPHAARHRDRRRARRRSTPLRPDIIGLNCATGPAEMSEHLRHLSPARRACRSRACPTPGLPSVVDGKMHYDLTPEQLAEYHARFVTELGVQRRRRLLRHHARAPPPGRRRARAATSTPARRTAEHEPGATSIYSLVPFHQDAVVPHHRRAHQRQRLEEVPRGDARRRLGHLRRRWPSDQVKEGAHVLDVCVDYVGPRRHRRHGRDRQPLRHPGRRVPLVLDSTEPQVMEAGLQWIGGRAILNSANLEDGEAEGTPLRPGRSRWPSEYGAAVICLLIDEEGQARDVEWKMRVAHRIHDLAVERYGLEPGDLHLRRADLPAVDRRRRPAPRRHGHHRGHPPHQGRAARASTRRSACRTCRSASSRRPATSSTRCSCTSASQAGPRLGHRARGADHAAEQDPRRAAQVCLDLIYDRRRRTATRLRPAARRCSRCSRTSTRPRSSKEDRTRLAGRASGSTQRIIDGDRDGPRRRPRRGPGRRASRRSPSSTTCCWPA